MPGTLLDKAGKSIGICALQLLLGDWRTQNWTYNNVLRNAIA
jgi:hypothetical protein